MAQVELRNVSKSFGNRAVLRAVNLLLKKDEICVVVGPSGCGKTTLLRIVAGLELSFDGDVFINNQRATKMWPSKRNLSMVFQQVSLFDHLTGYQNMAYPLRGRRLKREAIQGRISQIAELLGITSVLSKRPPSMSGGERQRVAIGRSLARQPDCLLLDEPMASLDPHLRCELRNLLRDVHRTTNGSMLIVSHDDVDALQLGHHVAVMNDGFIQQHGKPVDIYQYPVNRFVASFFGRSGMSFLQGILDITDDGPQLLLDSGERFAAYGQVERGQRVEMGLRPEGILPAGLAPSSWASIHGSVEYRRPMGAQVEFKVNCDKSNALRVLLPISLLDSSPKEGERARFAFDPNRVVIFAADERGDRLEVRMTEATPTTLKLIDL